MKLFLGQKPVKVLAERDLSIKEMKVLQDVNSYLHLDKSWRKFKKPELGIHGIGGLYLVLPAVVLPRDKAFIPIKIVFIDDRGVICNNKDTFYIKDFGARPSPSYLLGHFLNALSKPFEGKVDLELPRYAVILSNARASFINQLLSIAIKGKGKTIDYSWIAPFQELIENNEESLPKKRGRNKLINDSDPQPMEDLDVELGGAIERAWISRRSNPPTNKASGLRAILEDGI